MMRGTRKVDGLVCTTSLSAIKGPPFRIQEYCRPQARPESGRGQKNFDMVLDQGSLYAYYDTGKGLLIPSKYMPEERTEMRAPCFLPASSGRTTRRKGDKILQQCGLPPVHGKPPRQGSL